MQRIEQSMVVALARSAAGRLKGYGLFAGPEALVHGRAVVWCNAVCVRKEHVGSGLAAPPEGAVRDFLGLERPYFACRT
jgi:hypothetical protein